LECTKPLLWGGGKRECVLRTWCAQKRLNVNIVGGFTVGAEMGSKMGEEEEMLSTAASATVPRCVRGLVEAVGAVKHGPVDERARAEHKVAAGVSETPRPHT